MNEDIETIKQILCLQLRARLEGITEAEEMLLKECYRKIGYKENIGDKGIDPGIRS